MRRFDRSACAEKRLAFVQKGGGQGVFFSNTRIDDPDNEWAQYIREHYTQTAVFGEGMFSMRVFEKNTP